MSVLLGRQWGPEEASCEMRGWRGAGQLPGGAVRAAGSGSLQPLEVGFCSPPSHPAHLFPCTAEEGVRKPHLSAAPAAQGVVGANQRYRGHRGTPSGSTIPVPWGWRGGVLGHLQPPELPSHGCCPRVLLTPRPPAGSQPVPTERALPSPGGSDPGQAGSCG